MPLSALSPPQARVAAKLTESAQAAAASGKGRVVFVAGSPGSGRSHLLSSAAAMLPEAVPGVRVVIGGHTGDDAPPASDDLAAQRLPLADVLTAAASGASLLDPALMALGPLMATSVAVRRFVDSLRARGERLEAVELFGRALRTAMAEDKRRPMVCLVDKADWLDASWWFNLRFPFGEQIAAEMPLVLVLVVDGPAELPGDPIEGESAPCAAARSLMNRGLAEWCALGPLGEPELADWLGPAPRSLLSTALEISKGQSKTVAELWRSWEASGAVAPGKNGGWDLVKPAGLLPDAVEHLSSKIEVMLGPGWQGRHEDLPALLACGAMEGRAFTARAVAASADMDENAVIDLFDSLVDERHPERGVLRDLGAIEIPDPMRDRTEILWRFAFVRNLDWQAAKGWLDDEDTVLFAGAMSASLLSAYDPDIEMVAHVLASLCRTAGETESAKVFQRMAYTVSRTAMRSQAQYLLDADTAKWSAWDFLEAAERLLDASRELDADPLKTLLPFAERAWDHAHGAGAVGVAVQAEALAVQGRLLNRMGDVGGARERLLEAQRLVAHGPPEMLALVLMYLGDLEALRDDDLDPARSRLGEAEALFEECENTQCRAVCKYELGHLELTAKNLDEGRIHAKAAIELAAEVDDHDLEMSALHLLGTIEHLTGENEVAREHALTVLDYARKTGDACDEASCLCLLGDIAVDTGEPDLGFGLASDAIEMQQRLNVEVEEATGQLVRGKAARALGWVDDARESLLRSEELYLAVGRIRQAADVRELLEQT